MQVYISARAGRSRLGMLGTATALARASFAAAGILFPCSASAEEFAAAVRSAWIYDLPTQTVMMDRDAAPSQNLDPSR